MIYKWPKASDVIYMLLKSESRPPNQNTLVTHEHTRNYMRDFTCHDLFIYNIIALIGKASTPRLIVNSCIFQCKTVFVNPEMSSRCVIQHALRVLQNNHDGDGNDGEAENEGDGRWGPISEFTLCVRTGRDSPPLPLRGIERPHAIQVN